MNCLLCSLWIGLSHETSLITKVKEWEVRQSLLNSTNNKGGEDRNELYSIEMKGLCLLKGENENVRESVGNRLGWVSAINITNKMCLALFFFLKRTTN